MSEYDMLSQDHEKEPTRIDKVVAIDIDRTAIDSDRLADAITDIFKDLMPDKIATIEAEVQRIHASVGTELDYLPELVESLDLSVSVGEVVDLLFEPRTADKSPDERRDELRDEVLAAGFLKLLDQLEVRRDEVAYFLMTKGGAQTQQLKIAVVDRLIEPRRPIPALVTDSSAKAELADTEWFTDGRFTVSFNDSRGEGRLIALPPAKVFITIDDKDKNHQSKNQATRGIRIDNSGKATDGKYTLAEIADQLEAGMTIDDIAHHMPQTFD